MLFRSVPMVSSLDEITAIKQVITELKDQLKAEEQLSDIDMQLGIMVEVPAVAMQAEHYARQVDFLSIGTNDLTQYLLAVDRGNERISRLYNQHHPVVWNMIRQVAEAGRATGVPVSVCGELASEPNAACGLLGLGIRELSMTPRALPEVKRALCSHSHEEMKKLASRVLNSVTLSEIEDIFSVFSERRF